MFSSDRDSIRRQYVETWREYRAGKPLTPLGVMIARVVEDHPEYHALLEGGDSVLGREYPPEHGDTNPFLHMGMHLALREQVGTDRPPGVHAAYRRLTRATGDRLEAEHLMMAPLAEVLWQAQRAGRPPDEQAYLAALRLLVAGRKSRR